MVKICVCLETVFQEDSLEQRIRKVAEIGFDAFEIWFIDHWLGSKDHQIKDVKTMASIAKDCGIAFSNFVLNSPDGKIGGSLVSASDRSMYMKRLKKMASIAHELECNRLITCTGNSLGNVSRKKQHTNVVKTLKKAAIIAEREGLTLLLEPLNTLVDHAGYFLDSPHEAAQIVKEVSSPTVQLLFDCYHMQIMNGNIISTIEKNIDIIKHFHSAGVPGRHELFIGELNYANIVKRLDELGYGGYFGLEYYPVMSSERSLLATLKYLKYGTTVTY
ncbi:MAG: TIM barrel protein [Candidatus Bathyarchaeia archaeon]